MRACMLSPFTTLKIALIALFATLITTAFLFIPTQTKEEKLEHLTKNALVKFLELPLYFEGNVGQLPSEIKYKTQRLGHSFYFTEQEIAIAVPIAKKSEQKQEFSVLKMEFVKANQNLNLKGVDEQSCKSHYFIGSNSNQWHIDIPNYTKVIYENLYTGIDAVFYGNGQVLEYDLCVAPGADPNEVHVHFEGIKELTLDKKGNLQISTPDGQQLLMQKPFVYQINNEKKAEIPGEFVLLAKNDIGFKIGSYDRSSSLIIDPILSYSTHLGGSGEDFGVALAVDTSGNAYIAGLANSVDFPTTPGAFQEILTGDIDSFVSKLNASGTALIYSTYLGGSLNDLANELVIDSSGNAYITGSTFSPNYPTTPGAFQVSPPGSGANAFLTKLNATGSALIFSTYLGGSGVNQSASLAIDSAGNSYLTGLTTSADFPVTPGAFQTTLNGVFNSFITKFNSTGSALIYSTYLGGSQAEQGTRITVDSSNQAYAIGATLSTDFPVTPGAFQTSKPGATNGYVTKLNATGTALIYSTYLGGNNLDGPSGIAVDSTGNAHIVGFTDSTNFPTTPGAFQTSFLGTRDAFALKLNATGTGLIYSTLLGGSTTSQATSLVLEPSGSIYLVGITASPDFPTTPDAFQSTLAGGIDVILSQLNAEGSALLYSTYMGGSADDLGLGIALDGMGGLYIAGASASSNFPTTPDSFQPTLAGSNSAFIAKFRLAAPIVPIVTAISPNSGSESGGTVVTITGSSFTGTSEVFFGSTAAIFEIISDTKIRAIAPPGMGTVQVVITGPTGTSETTPASAFTYLPEPPQPGKVLPPTHLKGTQKKNRFLSQTDYINVLKWKAPKQGNPPISYKIYRLPQLNKAISVTPAFLPLEFKDHNRKKSKAYTYLIIAVDEFGNVSAPASITVKPN